MKSLIEAAIAILIVYLFFEWQKEQAANSSAAVPVSAVMPITTAPSPSPGGGCGCGGSGAVNYLPAIAPRPIAIISPATATPFRTTQATVSVGANSPMLPQPVAAPVADGPIMRPRYVVQGV